MHLLAVDMLRSIQMRLNKYIALLFDTIHLIFFIPGFNDCLITDKQSQRH
jgi:hypothetical protein